MDFKQSFSNLEKILDSKLEDTIVEDEQSLITTIQNKNYLPYGENLENGVFLVNISKKESFSENEKKLFFNNEKLFTEYSEKFKDSSYATAFRYKNYIVTNYHACRGQDVLLKDYTDKIVYAKVLGYNLVQDVCVLSINNISKYQDFAVKKMESTEYNDESLRKIASSNNPSLTKKIAAVFSMRGNFEIKGISKDTQQDEYSKTNAFVSFNNNQKCISGTSGSPVINQSGLIGIIWGASHSKNPFEKETACFFLDKTEIDKVIVKIEQSL